MPLIHPEVGVSITSYDKLANNPLMKETWTKVMTMGLGNIAQGHKATNTSGTNSEFFLYHDAIENVHADRKITYACIVVKYKPQIPDPNRVRSPVGGICIEYSHYIISQTADLVTTSVGHYNVMMSL